MPSRNSRYYLPNPFVSNSGNRPFLPYESVALSSHSILRELVWDPLKNQLIVLQSRRNCSCLELPRRAVIAAPATDRKLKRASYEGDCPIHMLIAAFVNSTSQRFRNGFSLLVLKRVTLASFRLRPAVLRATRCESTVFSTLCGYSKTFSLTSGWLFNLCGRSVHFEGDGTHQEQVDIHA